MRAEDIFEAITDISDKNLETKPKKRKHWRSLAAIAAVLALAVGLLPRMGGSGGGGGVNEGSAGGSGGGGTTFMSYAGPVFPLSAAESGLSASRELSWDFSPWQPVWYSIDDMLAEMHPDTTPEELAQARAQYEEWFPEGGYERSSSDVLVRDKYTLTGEGEYTLVYPFTSSITELERLRPTLSLNGTELECELSAGNLGDFYEWSDYEAGLENGEYMTEALENDLSAEDTPVIVYRAVDIAAPDDSEQNVNPTLEWGFDIDYDKTRVLSYGFNGATYDREGGRMYRNSSVGQARWRSEPHFLIVIGEDIGEITQNGYRTGDTSANNALEGVSARIVREETTLGAALREAAEDFARMREEPEDADMLYGVLLRGIESGWMEGAFDDLESQLSDALGRSRVFYLSVRVNVREGDVLEAAMLKEASFDFYCAHTENRGVYGYDMATQLGSSLNFTSQTAAVENFENCAIVRQNLGLDPEKGIFSVELDQSVPHYYLEVKRAEK
ncbi:MAG: hypothetical protein ACOX81_04330 [Candidatus Heteroscillospira sp.]